MVYYWTNVIMREFFDNGYLEYGGWFLIYTTITFLGILYDIHLFRYYYNHNILFDAEYNIHLFRFRYNHTIFGNQSLHNVILVPIQEVML